MKTTSVTTSVTDLTAATAKLTALSPNMILLFGSTDVMSNEAAMQQLHASFPGAQIAGCSTSGEITKKGADDGKLVVTAVQFDSTKLKSVAKPLTSAENSNQVGRDLAKELLADDLKAVIVFAPGVNVNGNELVKGMRDVLPANVTLTGGLAGDGTRFQETRTTLNGKTYNSEAVAIGLYGDKVVIGSGSRGGWKPFGPTRRVTKSRGNVLLELDGKSALQLYKDYLGPKAAELPASGLLYPFAIMREDRSTSGLIRTILDVNHEEGSLTLAGDLPEGSLVCLMHSDPASLAQGAADAANEAFANSNDKESDSLALCVSCVGRRLVMGDDVDDEIDATADVLGDNAAICGFYSYGEIAPFAETGKAELHNQTMTITHITEIA